MTDDRRPRQDDDDDPAGGLPAWLVSRDDEDGLEGFSMLGHGEDDEP